MGSVVGVVEDLVRVVEERFTRHGGHRVYTGQCRDELPDT